MSVKKMLWIDDDYSNRATKLKAVAEALGLDIVRVEKKASASNWFDALSQCVITNKLTSGNVSLIIVDHYLAVRGGSSTIYDKGASLCSSLKIQFPDVPILGLSNANQDGIPVGQLREYTFFVELSALPTNLPVDGWNMLWSVKSVMDGYEGVRKSYRAGGVRTDVLIRLAKPPEADWADFQRVVPLSLRGGDLRGRANEVFSWYVDVLLNYQGVLVDTLCASAMIGATEEFFVQTILPELSRACRYEGIFAAVKGARFWRKRLLHDLRGRVKSKKSCKLSHYIEELSDDKKHWAKCISCKGYFTELAAYKERNMIDSLNGRGPAHRMCVGVADEPCPVYFEPKYINKKGLR